MLVEISKRKLESYRRAEVIARECRYQLQSVSYRNETRIADAVIHWMGTTGKIKYDRPEIKAR